jgi:hypothetical protein
VGAGVASAAILAVLGIADHGIFTAAGFVALPQRPLRFFAAHCLASLPEQQFLADLMSLSCLQQAMSLLCQQDMALPVSAWHLESSDDRSRHSRISPPERRRRRRSLSGDNRQPSGQQENCENCRHSSFHFFTFRFFVWLEKWEARPTRTEVRFKKNQEGKEKVRGQEP